MNRPFLIRLVSGKISRNDHKISLKYTHFFILLLQTLKKTISKNMKRIFASLPLLLLFAILTYTACESGGNKAEAEFTSLFNGENLDGWVGNTQSYQAQDGMIVVNPDVEGAEGSGGNLYTEKEYSDFVFRFEFQLPPGGNNGLGIHAPLEGDAAYVGKEIQILDNTAEIYADLQPYQYHGSVYGIIPAKRGYLKPVGEWNEEEVIVQGSKIKVILNGTTILDGDFLEASKNGTMDGKDHPGLERTKGHIGFLGHGYVVKFRNIRIKDLSEG
jgi:hypothetical protein